MKRIYENNTIVTNVYASEEFGYSFRANMHNRMLPFPFPSYMGDGGSTTIETPITYGPWGGSGGTIFDDGMYTGIRQINLKRVSGICMIQILYDRNGQAVWGNKHGYIGTLGISHQIKFDFPTEILTHVTGYIGHTMLMGPTVIKSLTFHTTKMVHGPYGQEYGKFFSSCLSEGRIVGFHGREGWYIDSIGVRVLERKVLAQQVISGTDQRQISQLVIGGTDQRQISQQLIGGTDQRQISQQLIGGTDQRQISQEVIGGTDQGQISQEIIGGTDQGQISHQVIGGTDQRKISQQIIGGTGTDQRQISRDISSDSNKFSLVLRKGGYEVTFGVLKEDDGGPWDDGVYTGIKQILITRGKFIHSIQIEYDHNGQSVWSSRHGGTGEFCHRIKFDYPTEVLNCITGYYNTNPHEGPVALRSISLYSNRGKYGPLGEEVGTYFTSGTTKMKVVGFHGRSGLHLDAIGVHIQH